MLNYFSDAALDLLVYLRKKKHDNYIHHFKVWSNDTKCNLELVLVNGCTLNIVFDEKSDIVTNEHEKKDDIFYNNVIIDIQQLLLIK